MSTPIYRLHDPARGPFCDVDKQGNALNMPPVQREPITNRDTNPRGVRRPGKTYQDHLPVGQRQRVQDADRRRAKAQQA